MKGNPNPSPATRFKPGQSGNPGGLTKEAKALLLANAEKASRIRARLLEQIEAGELELSADLLRALKDSEDRGYGAPKQEIEHDVTDPLGSLLEAVASGGKRIGN